MADVEFRTFRWSAICAYLLGTLVAYVSNRAGLGIPPLQGIGVALLAVPLLDVAFTRAGVSQAHATKEPVA